MLKFFKGQNSDAFRFTKHLLTDVFCCFRAEVTSFCNIIHVTKRVFGKKYRKIWKNMPGNHGKYVF